MKKIQNIFLALILVLTPSLYCADFLNQFVKTDSKKNFFMGVIEEKQKLLDEYTTIQAELAAFNKTFFEKIARKC